SSIQAKSVQAVAFSQYFQGDQVGNPVLSNSDTSAAPYRRSVATANDAFAMLAAGTALAQANTTFNVPVGLHPSVLYMPTLAAGRFDSNYVLLADQFANDPYAAAEGLATNAEIIATVPVAIQTNVTPFAPPTSVIQGVSLVGDGGSVQTVQWINGNITSTGPMGDLTVQSTRGITGNVTATRIFGSVLSTYGPISGTIQTTGVRTDPITGAATSGNADWGRIYTDRTGPVPLVVDTTITAFGSISGRLISRGKLISQVALANGTLTGLIAAAGDVGTNGRNNAGQLTRFGGFQIGGPVTGRIVTLGNVVGDTSLGNMVGGRIAVGGSVLGNLTFNGLFDANSALVARGQVGSTTNGTVINVRNVGGILASRGPIAFGLTGSVNSGAIFNNVGAGTDASSILDAGAIDAVFADEASHPITAFDVAGLDLGNLNRLLVDVAGLRTTTNAGVKVLTDA
ncbi:MAG TPA: hypothetical protein VGH33_19790, partial [Isosphaeraceae bacterium]